MRNGSSVLKPLSWFFSLLFRSGCTKCGQDCSSSGYHPFCDRCWASIRKHGGTGCRRCGAVTLYDVTDACQDCRSIRPVFDQLIAFGIYEGVLKQAIHQMKFGRIKRLARMLGRELCRLDLPAVDSIVPVPLSVQGLKQREFNQSAIIAAELSRYRRLPLDLSGLIKRRETEPQSSLPREKRIENVRGAFSGGHALQGKTVMLVDDVVTTAATVNECSKVLKKAGVKSVIVVTAARAISG